MEFSGRIGSASRCAGRRGECVCKFTYIYAYVCGQRVCATTHSHMSMWKINTPDRPTDQPTHRRWRRNAQTRRDVSVVIVVVFVDVLFVRSRVPSSTLRYGRRNQGKRSAGRSDWVRAGQETETCFPSRIVIRAK